MKYGIIKSALSTLIALSCVERLLTTEINARNRNQDAATFYNNQVPGSQSLPNNVTTTVSRPSNSKVGWSDSVQQQVITYTDGNSNEVSVVGPGLRTTYQPSSRSGYMDVIQTGIPASQAYYDLTGQAVPQGYNPIKNSGLVGGKPVYPTAEGSYVLSSSGTAIPESQIDAISPSSAINLGLGREQGTADGSKIVSIGSSYYQVSTDGSSVTQVDSNRFPGEGGSVPDSNVIGETTINSTGPNGTNADANAPEGTQQDTVNGDTPNTNVDAATEDSRLMLVDPKSHVPGKLPNHK